MLRHRLKVVTEDAHPIKSNERLTETQDYPGLIGTPSKNRSERRTMKTQTMLGMSGAVTALFFSAVLTFKSRMPIEIKNEVVRTLFHSDGANQVDNRESMASSCSVYLAPSSVSGGGMGMFTVKPVKLGETILPADGPSIPIIDPDYSQASLDTWVNLFSSYWWGHDGGINDAAFFESYNTAELQITVGALPNSHPYLDNLEVAFPEIIPYDDSVLDRTTNPGAGASSLFLGRDAIAYRDIDAGEELFLGYPETYMAEISEKYNIPNVQDYEETGLIVSNLYTKYGKNFNRWVWDETEISERVKSLLPKSQTDLDNILPSTSKCPLASTKCTWYDKIEERAKSFAQERFSFFRKKLLSDESQYTSFVARTTFAIAKEISVNKRSPEWIRNHGICLENIIPGRSLNKQAGNGAFANRFMRKGDIIAPASLLQITNKDALRMSAFKGENWQLLLNYCLGHEDSSLLLCPITNAVLVNHCSGRRPEMHSCGRDIEPNAKYRWATWDGATTHWLEKSIKEMERDGGRGLSLEIVATRDIEKGEEVYIDYGIKWEEAWDDHVRNWKPPTTREEQDQKEEKWISTKELNEELGPLTVAPNFSAKHISFGAQNGMFTACFYYEDDQRFWDQFGDEETWDETTSINGTINKFGKSYGEAYDVEEYEVESGDFWPCIVTRKDSAPSTEHETYTVRVLQSKIHDETIWETCNFPRIISNYPRKSIRHFYLPYKSDIHLPNVFRHHMELPDNLFPGVWKDRSNQ